MKIFYWPLNSIEIWDRNGGRVIGDISEIIIESSEFDGDIGDFDYTKFLTCCSGLKWYRSSALRAMGGGGGGGGALFL